ncbi:MAG: hypothetical protein ACR2P1_09725 [Pseudomonadales bacterium]
METVLRAGGEYDDNVRLDEDDIDIAGVVVSPKLNFGVRTERFDLALNTALDFARFNKSEYNSDDQDIALASSYAFEYNVFKAAAQIKRDSTRTSEFLDTGEIGETAARREAQNLTLAWQHLFTEKQSLELSASYANVEYESTNSNLNDYDYAGINAAYAIALSDRTRLITQVVANRFGSDTFGDVLFGQRATGAVCQPGSFVVIGTTIHRCPSFVSAEIEQDTYGMNVGVERILSEKLLFSIAVGANYVESSFDSREADIFSEQSRLDLLAGLEDEDDTSFFLSSTLRYSGERTTLSLNLSSNTKPSANGYLLLSNQLLFNVDYQLSERSKVFARLDLIDSRSVGDAVDSSGRSLSSNDRTYGAARVGASYRLTEAWYLEASYRYRAQDREFFDEIAKSNAAYLKIVYKPHKKTWSR